jgi:hypothetical protein
MPSLLEELKTTVSSRWRQALVHGNKNDKRHWGTKESYYHALVATATESGYRGRLRSRIIETVEPRGSIATFYTVIGPKARHALIKAYFDAESDRPDLAEVCSHDDATDQLIDEVKVWSYWPSREGWLLQLDELTDPTRELAAESLVRVLVDWSVNNSVVATLLDYAPPICAVEDLLAVQKDRSAVDAFRLLRQVVCHAQGPLAMVTDGVLTAVRADLHGTVTPRSTSPEHLLAQIADAVYSLTHLSLTMPDKEIYQALAAAAAYLQEALDRADPGPEEERDDG